MWLQHLYNSLGRSWDATVTAFGTTTLGFVVWTLALSAIGWFAGVAATWHKLWSSKILIRSDKPFATRFLQENCWPRQ